MNESENPTFLKSFLYAVQLHCNRYKLMCDSRKRAEVEGRKSSFPCSKAMSSHHPTDPVELRRINFQTPGEPGSHVHKHHLYFIKVYLFLRLNLMLFPFFSLPCISVPRLSPFVKLVGLSLLSLCFFSPYSFFLFFLLLHLSHFYIYIYFWHKKKRNNQHSHNSLFLSAALLMRDCDFQSYVL